MKRSRPLRLLFCVHVLGVVAAGIGCRQSPVQQSPATGQLVDAQPPDPLSDALLILEELTNIDGGQSISSRNSQVLVQTPGIDAVVARGMSVMPALMVILNDDRLSFDTFTRCHSACDQILRKVDPNCKVLWYGGCEIRHDGPDKDRIFPGGQIDPVEFRRKRRRTSSGILRG